jgi:predicted nucleic acid-binding protein
MCLRFVILRFAHRMIGNSCRRYVETIDAGEAEAIVWAIELKATRLIDEVAGRRAASAAGVPYMGVLGVLARAKRERLISEVRPLP